MKNAIGFVSVTNTIGAHIWEICDDYVVASWNCEPIIDCKCSIEYDIDGEPYFELNDYAFYLNEVERV